MSHRDYFGTARAAARDRRGKMESHRCSRKMRRGTRRCCSQSTRRPVPSSPDTVFAPKSPLVMKMNSHFAREVLELHKIRIVDLAAVPQLDPLHFSRLFALSFSLPIRTPARRALSRIFTGAPHHARHGMAQQSRIAIRSRNDRNRYNEKTEPLPGPKIPNAFHRGTNLSKLLFSAL